jgi:hypothetical protein
MTIHSHLAGSLDAYPTTSLGRLMRGGTGLTDAELAGIAAALDPCWCMVPHHDLGGEAMAMMMAASPVQPMNDLAQPLNDSAQPSGSPAHRVSDLPPPDEDAAPTWIIHREGALLRLDVCRGDTYTRLGAYAALVPLLASLHLAMEAAGGR